MARVGQQVVGLDEDRLPGRVAVGVLTRVFPPALVDEVVAGAGVVEQRIRVLPARLVVYYTLAMILFFQSSYSQVWVKLVGGLDWARSFRARVAVGMSPSPAAIAKARARLGWQVMADLLERVAGPLAGQDDGWAYVAGLRLVAVDGLTVDVPDTAANATQFGRPGGGAGPGAFPQVRVVALAECGSRALMGARCAGITTGEQGLTTELTGLFGAGMLVVADRNFLSHQVLRDTLTTGAHALLRAKSDLTRATFWLAGGRQGCDLRGCGRGGLFEVTNRVVGSLARGLVHPEGAYGLGCEGGVDRAQAGPPGRRDRAHRLRARRRPARCADGGRPGAALARPGHVGSDLARRGLEDGHEFGCGGGCAGRGHEQPAAVGRSGWRLRTPGVRRCGRRDVQAAGAGADHRADVQGRHDPGPGRDRCERAGAAHDLPLPGPVRGP